MDMELELEQRQPQQQQDSVNKRKSTRIAARPPKFHYDYQYYDDDDFDEELDLDLAKGKHNQRKKSSRAKKMTSRTNGELVTYSTPTKTPPSTPPMASSPQRQLANPNTFPNLEQDDVIKAVSTLLAPNTIHLATFDAVSKAQLLKDCSSEMVQSRYRTKADAINDLLGKQYKCWIQLQKRSHCSVQIKRLSHNQLSRLQFKEEDKIRPSSAVMEFLNSHAKKKATRKPHSQRDPQSETKEKPPQLSNYFLKPHETKASKKSFDTDMDPVKVTIATEEARPFVALTEQMELMEAPKLDEPIQIVQNGMVDTTAEEEDDPPMPVLTREVKISTSTAETQHRRKTHMPTKLENDQIEKIDSKFREDIRAAAKEQSEQISVHRPYLQSKPQVENRQDEDEQEKCQKYLNGDVTLQQIKHDKTDTLKRHHPSSSSSFSSSHSSQKKSTVDSKGSREIADDKPSPNVGSRGIDAVSALSNTKIKQEHKHEHKQRSKSHHDKSSHHHHRQQAANGDSMVTKVHRDRDDKDRHRNRSKSPKSTTNQKPVACNGDSMVTKAHRDRDDKDRHRNGSKSPKATHNPKPVACNRDSTVTKVHRDRDDKDRHRNRSKSPKSTTNQKPVACNGDSMVTKVHRDRDDKDRHRNRSKSPKSTNNQRPVACNGDSMVTKFHRDRDDKDRHRNRSKSPKSTNNQTPVACNGDSMIKLHRDRDDKDRLRDGSKSPKSTNNQKPVACNGDSMVTKVHRDRDDKDRHRNRSKSPKSTNNRTPAACDGDSMVKLHRDRDDKDRLRDGSKSPKSTNNQKPAASNGDSKRRNSREDEEKSRHLAQKNNFTHSGSVKVGENSAAAHATLAQNKVMNILSLFQNPLSHDFRIPKIKNGQYSAAASKYNADNATSCTSEKSILKGEDVVVGLQHKALLPVSEISSPKMEPEVARSPPVSEEAVEFNSQQQVPIDSKSVPEPIHGEEIIVEQDVENVIDLLNTEEVEEGELALEDDAAEYFNIVELPDFAGNEEFAYDENTDSYYTTEFDPNIYYCNPEEFEQVVAASSSSSESEEGSHAPLLEEIHLDGLQADGHEDVKIETPEVNAFEGVASAPPARRVSDGFQLGEIHEVSLGGAPLGNTSPPEIHELSSPGVHAEKVEIEFTKTKVVENQILVTKAVEGAHIAGDATNEEASSTLVEPDLKINEEKKESETAKDDFRAEDDVLDGEDGGDSENPVEIIENVETQSSAVPAESQLNCEDSDVKLVLPLPTFKEADTKDDTKMETEPGEQLDELGTEKENAKENEMLEATSKIVGIESVNKSQDLKNEEAQHVLEAEGENQVFNGFHPVAAIPNGQTPENLQPIPIHNMSLDDDSSVPLKKRKLCRMENNFLHSDLAGFCQY